VITPLLFLVLFGTIEFSRMIVSRQMLAYSVIEGARTASILGNTTDTSVTDQVTAAAPLLTLGTITITDMRTGNTGPTAMSDRTPGDTIQVSTTYQFVPAITIGGLGTKTWTETQQAVVQ
jgi:Flp pilus assembly protein TadG